MLADVSHSGAAFAQAGAITLCYDTFGERSAVPIVLVMGLAAQMIVWDDDFCRELAARGRFVVRFDNRDIGLSTHLRDERTPSIFETLVSQMMRRRSKTRYTLLDVARDTVGLLDALGLPSAHVVGVSMGGAIAQEMAINFRARVRTLCSIMSSTGATNLPPPTLAALGVLLSRPNPSRERYLDQYVKRWHVLAGNGFAFDAERTRRQGALGFERGIDPAGVSRQMLAIVASGDRTAALRTLAIPALVIHGTNDPLMRYAAAPKLRDAIPGATLLRVPGMGHTLPRGAWPRILDAIQTLTARENG